VTTGSYVDANFTFNGFVRTPDGAITTFDAPGAGTAPNQGTMAGATNPAGETAGAYIDSNNMFHGFLRTP